MWAYLWLIQYNWDLWISIWIHFQGFESNTISFGYNQLSEVYFFNSVKINYIFNHFEPDDKISNSKSSSKSLYLSRILHYPDYHPDSRRWHSQLPKRENYPDYHSDSRRWHSQLPKRENYPDYHPDSRRWHCQLPKRENFPDYHPDRRRWHCQLPKR